MADLGAIERGLRSNDEIERYERFLSLYHSKDPKDSSALAGLLQGDDPLLKALILDFLTEIPERVSVKWILPLLEDLNPVIRTAAAKAFLSNQYPRKHRLLRPFIFSPRIPAGRFAIRTLSRSGDTDIVPLLIRELPDAPEPVQREILSALGILPDSASVDAIAPFLRASGEETRFRAIRSLADLLARGIRMPASHFLERVQDESDRIRRTALEALRHYPSPAIARIFLRQAVDEMEAQENRLRAIASIPSFPLGGAVKALVRLVVREGKGPLVLASEMALKQFPHPLLKAELIALLTQGDPELRYQSALLLAESFEGDDDVRRLAVDLWAKAKNLRTKIAMVDVLRKFRHPEVVKILFSALRGSPVLAYAAISALTHLRSADVAGRVIALLHEDDVPSLIKQAVLTSVLTYGLDQQPKDDLMPWLIQALEDPVLNIRYLALQILGSYPLENTVDAILALLSREENRDVVLTSHRILLKGLGRDPMPLISAWVKRPEDGKVAVNAAAILGNQTWDEGRIFDLFFHLTLEPLSLQYRHPQTFLDLCLHLMERRAVTLENVWLFLASDEMRLDLLRMLRDAMKDPVRDMPPLPIGFLAFHLSESDPQSRRFLFELFELNRRPEGIPALTGYLLKERDAQTLAAGRAALRRLIETAR